MQLSAWPTGWYGLLSAQVASHIPRQLRPSPQRPAKRPSVHAQHPRRLRDRPSLHLNHPPCSFDLCATDAGWPSDPDAALAGGLHPLLGPLRENLALELGLRGAHRVDEHAAGRGRVDIQMRDLERDPPLAQLFLLAPRIHDIAKGAVQVPDHQSVAPSEPPQDFAVDRPPDSFGRLRLEIHFVAHFIQADDLAVEALLGRADPDISNSIHFQAVSTG